MVEYLSQSDGLKERLKRTFTRTCNNHTERDELFTAGHLSRTKFGNNTVVGFTGLI